MERIFTKADILLPKFSKDSEKMSKWAVVACDQYTSEPEYWEEVRRITKGEKSTLELILPEIYLKNPDVDRRIAGIDETMKQYIDEGVFTEYKDSLIYVERVQSDGRMRAGIVGAIDMEGYNYNKGSQSPVRATEATVAKRLPPRIKVREKAEIELPHIMILIDDVKKPVIEPLEAVKDRFEKLYDFDLMCGGGHITGYLLDDAACEQVFAALDKLSDKAAFNEKYGVSDQEPLVFAMGDGNHSLATAKAIYDRLKAENPDKDMSKHPARYALAEIVDLHSPALEFEAIHRVVTDDDEDRLIEEAKEALGLSHEPSDQKITLVINAMKFPYYIHKPTANLAVGTFVNFIDAYAEKYGSAIDYIHGSDVVSQLSKTEGNVGFLLEDMSKAELFPTVIKDGALPRKTFSMGHAADKRFYVEARKITEQEEN